MRGSQESPKHRPLNDNGTQFLLTTRCSGYTDLFWLTREAGQPGNIREPISNCHSAFNYNRQ